MARAHGARARLALAFETSYGTAPEAGYWQMPFVSSTLGAEQPLLSSELLGYGRDPQTPLADVVTADGDVVVPIDTVAFGFWLKAAFGAPVTTGSAPGPFTHVFTSGDWDLPSMAIEVAMPEVPRYAMMAGCVLDQLSWQMTRGGLLTATARLIAQGEALAEVSGIETPDVPEFRRFGHMQGSISRNGGTLGNVVSAELTYANGIDRIETIRADGRIDGADPGMAALSGRLEVRFADQTLIDQAVAGAACALSFGYALPSGESLTLEVPAVFLPRPRVEIPGPQGIQASFDWQAARDSAAGHMCRATLVNMVESY
ncbi:MAG: phage tail tube protein [Roseinatronobacter sp.]